VSTSGGLGVPDFTAALRLISYEKGLADRITGWTVNPGLEPAEAKVLDQFLDYLRRCSSDLSPSKILDGLISEANLSTRLGTAFRAAYGFTHDEEPWMSDRLSAAGKPFKLSTKTMQRARSKAAELLAAFLANRPPGPLRPGDEREVPTPSVARSRARNFTLQLDVSIELNSRNQRPTAICEHRVVTALDQPVYEWTTSSTSGAWKPGMLKHYGDGRFHPELEASGLLLAVAFDPPLAPEETASFVITRVDDTPSEARSGKWGLTGRDTVRQLCVRLVGSQVPSRAWWYYEHAEAKVPGKFLPERSILSAEMRRRKVFDEVLIGDHAGIAWEW
jgi:hypothetical protein